MMRRTIKTRTRAVVLGVVTMIGGTAFSGCSMGDLRLNVVAGVMGFVEDYTTDLLGVLVPAPSDLVGGEEGA